MFSQRHPYNTNPFQSLKSREAPKARPAIKNYSFRCSYYFQMNFHPLLYINLGPPNCTSTTPTETPSPNGRRELYTQKTVKTRVIIQTHDALKVILRTHTAVFLVPRRGDSLFISIFYPQRSAIRIPKRTIHSAM